MAECEDNCGHDHSNPLANLDQETQAQIQELQMMEQSFQQLLMQKNAFSMEASETDLIIREVEKTSGEVSRIIGGQVVIKTTKEAIIEEMKKKKELIKIRMKAIDEQEQEFSTKIESVREEIIKKIQG
ncbi:MAG: prefoldin subunit [archaeon]